MEVAEIVQLLTTFGPPAITLIDGLIAKAEARGTVSLAEWTTLSASVRTTAKDEMNKVLSGAGVDPSSTQGSAALAATV